MFRPGEQVGQYRVTAKIKEGGMATLYLCERSGAAGFQKHVAMKVVHSNLSQDERFIEMFVDEAMISSRIQHPNVVHVEELGEVDGMYYLVMEYVHGCSVAQLLRALAQKKRRMRPELAVNIAIAAADGLHAAHETRGPDGRVLNVVHRDVSPENILLSSNGHVKLIDFGVAKSRDRVAQTTAGGTIKGKFSYMAPEHARNLPVDRRADVYQLGIVLWEMLTMQRCFKGKMSLEFLERVRNPVVRPPSEIAPGVPPDLEAAVMKALSPRPADRFPTAQAMRRALATAAPNSLALDSSHLAELLATMLGDELEDDRLNLSMETPQQSSFDESAVLATLTVDNLDLTHPSDIDDEAQTSPPPEMAPGKSDTTTSAGGRSARDTSFRSAVGLSDPDPREAHSNVFDDDVTEPSSYDPSSFHPPPSDTTSEQIPSRSPRPQQPPAAQRPASPSRRQYVRWLAGAVAIGFVVAGGVRLLRPSEPEWNLIKPKAPKRGR